MFHLAFGEVHIAFVVAIGQRQLAALTAHLKRLHQVDHVHLHRLPRNTPSDVPRLLRHLLERDLVDHLLDPPGRFFQEEWLLDKVVYRIVQVQFFADVCLGRHQDDGRVLGGFGGS